MLYPHNVGRCVSLYIGISGAISENAAQKSGNRIFSFNAKNLLGPERGLKF
jgi:hypothetical protein